MSVRRRGRILTASLLLGLCSVTACDRGKPAETNRENVASETAAATASPGIERDDRSDDTAKLQRAAEQLRQENYQSAERILRSVLLGDPSNLDAGVMLIHCLSGSGRQTDAAEWSEAMAGSHADRRDEFEAQAAQLYGQAGDEARALQIYRDVLQRSPGFHAARYGLFQLLRGKGFLFQANEQARKLIGHLPLSFTELVGLVQPTFPSATFSEKPNPQDTELLRRVGALNMAAALQSRGDIRDAIDALKQIRWTESERAETIAMRCWLLVRAQRWADATEEIARSDVDLTPFPAFWMAAGGIALRRRDAAAITCFLTAIEREPNLAEAYDGLLQAIRMHPKRLTHADETIERFEKRRKQVADTRFFVDQIGAGQDRDGRMIGELGKLLSRMGRPLESLAWQEMAVRQRGGNPAALKTIADYKRQVLSKYPSGRDATIVRCRLPATALPATQPLLADLKRPDVDRGPASAASSIPIPQPPVFTDVADASGLRMQYLNASEPILRQFQIHQSLGAGVACLDYDQDGHIDCYFGQGGFRPPEGQSDASNRLFRLAGATFRDITDPSGAHDYGYTHGVTSGDWNQDGWPDLLVGNLGNNQLLINNGDGTFHTEDLGRLDASGLWDISMFTTGVAIADVTGDALPDIVEVNYLDDPDIFSPNAIGSDGEQTLQVGPLYYDAAVDRVFRSTGEGSVVGQRLGEGGGLPSTGLGLLITDLDGKTGNEIFVANDQLANHFWKRQPLSSSVPASTSASSEPCDWKESAVAAGLAFATSGKPLACMGIAPADFDGNGLTDLHITNYVDEWSNLYLQVDPGIFQDAAARFGLDVATNPHVGFGTQAIDHDNNTTWDLVIGNGHTEDFSRRGVPFKMPTQVLVRQADGFRQAEVQGDDEYWRRPHVGRGLARCDWNRDGRTDFVLTDLLDPAALFQNNSDSDNHFLQIGVVGVDCERDAIGARVCVRFGDRMIVQRVQTGDGYASKNESVLFFGLGEANQVESIDIQWPDGSSDTFGPLTADARVMLIQGQNDVWTLWRIRQAAP